jgi:hypothetical protein
VTLTFAPIPKTILILQSFERFRQAELKLSSRNEIVERQTDRRPDRQSDYCGVLIKQIVTALRSSGLRQNTLPLKTCSQECQYHNKQDKLTSKKLSKEKLDTTTHWYRFPVMPFVCGLSPFRFVRFEPVNGNPGVLVVINEAISKAWETTTLIRIFSS